MYPVRIGFCECTTEINKGEYWRRVHFQTVAQFVGGGGGGALVGDLQCSNSYALIDTQLCAMCSTKRVIKSSSFLGPNTGRARNKDFSNRHKERLGWVLRPTGMFVGGKNAQVMWGSYRALWMKLLELVNLIHGLYLRSPVDLMKS